MNQLFNPISNGGITLPGAHQLSLTGIKWAGEPTDDEFKQIDQSAQVFDLVSAWVDGDVCIEYVRREQHKRPGMTVLSLLHEYSTARNKQIDTTQRRYNVALCFGSKDRLSGNGITWSHHEVIWAVGIEPLWKAKALLKQAQDQGWSVAQLRAHIRQNSRPAPCTEPRLPGFLASELQNAVDWAAARLGDVEDMPTEQAYQVLSEAQPLALYIDALRARVATPTKESINSAA